MAARIFNDLKLAQTNYAAKTGGYTMQRNFETSFVTQCAPVLAGLKVANLFRWVEPDASAMHAMAERWAAELKPKGVTVSIIKECPVTHAYLVYVYRAKSLEESLQQPDVQQYLLREGYPQGGLQECLDHLSRCLCCEADWRFPWLSAGRCRWLCGKQGQKLYVLRLLEMLWRPRCSTKDV